MVDARFLKPATGQTPTLPAHLATKNYVDLADTALSNRVTTLEGKLPLGEMSYTVTSTTLSFSAATDTQCSFQQENIPTVGLSLNSGTDKYLFTVLAGYAGWWDITVSIRFDFVTTEKYVAVATPSKVWWDKNSNAGAAYNCNVHCKNKLAVGDVFSVWVYSGIANKVIREGSSLISGVKAVQLRTL